MNVTSYEYTLVLECAMAMRPSRLFSGALN